MSDHNSNIVVVGCIVRDGKIFIAKRANTKKIFPDRYELIGGHVEPGESLEEALVREIHEEVGVDVRVGQIVDAFSHEYKGEFKVEIGYLCYLVDPVQEPSIQPAEHSESQWIAEDEISKFGKEDEETLMLRKAFRMIRGDKK